MAASPSADASLARLGYVRRTADGGWETAGDCAPRASYAGPLWHGPLHSSELLQTMKLDIPLGAAKRIEKLLPLWKAENSMPPLLHTTAELGRIAKRSPPPLTALLDALHAAGFRAAATHFDPTGFKTDAAMKDIRRVFDELR